MTVWTSALTLLRTKMQRPQLRGDLTILPRNYGGVTLLERIRLFGQHSAFQSLLGRHCCPGMLSC
jgi:hypothetical protein